mmetsp:Transcript_5172/g.13884  ORF Transcript_5172/g.13884 Transcript_5172/m.13884 type:complete len:264 (-) Transcript_5172:634-1425(-)
MKSVVALAGLVLFAAVAAAQTCPCSFAPTGVDTQIVLDQPGSPNLCARETRPTGGCFCVPDEGSAGVCQIDTSAVRWEFVGAGPVCRSISNPVAVCPPGVRSVSRRCEIDTNVAWTLDCSVPRSAFPGGATISAIEVRIKQEDNFTFTGSGPPGNAYSLSYQTDNIILPLNAFPTWPDTPLKENEGIIPPSGQGTYTAGSDVPQLTLNALASGIGYAQGLYNGNNDIIFRFETELLQASSGFLETEFFPTFSHVVVDLTVSYT